jgi:hypothetical protein
MSTILFLFKWVQVKDGSNMIINKGEGSGMSHRKSWIAESYMKNYRTYERRNHIETKCAESYIIIYQNNN